MKHPFALVLLGLIGCFLSYILGIATVHVDPAPNTVCSFADHKKSTKCIEIDSSIVWRGSDRIKCKRYSTYNWCVSITGSPIIRYDTLHNCPFELCLFKDKPGYIEHDDCTKGSECYVMDSLHLINPSVSYDQLDSILSHK